MNPALILLSLLAGSAIALQSSMSGQLSQRLQNPLLSLLVLYITGAVSLMITLVVKKTPLPNSSELINVPAHLWFVGGIVSSLGLSLVYWLMPQIGIAKVVSALVVGQLFFSMTASHFGWFELPQSEISLAKLIGLLLMMMGVILINK